MTNFRSHYIDSSSMPSMGTCTLASTHPRATRRSTKTRQVWDYTQSLAAVRFQQSRVPGTVEFHGEPSNRRRCTNGNRQSESDIYLQKGEGRILKPSSGGYGCRYGLDPVLAGFLTHKRTRRLLVLLGSLQQRRRHVSCADVSLSVSS